MNTSTVNLGLVSTTSDFDSAFWAAKAMLENLEASSVTFHYDGTPVFIGLETTVGEAFDRYDLRKIESASTPSAPAPLSNPLKGTVSPLPWMMF